MSGARQRVEERYSNLIKYYWHVAGRNKRAYKWSRYLTIVLGSTVTLIASLSSSTLFADHPVALSLGTPVLAALLTVVGSFAQSFQWGAGWREMVLLAERLERELDRIRLTPDAALDPQKDLRILNDLVIQETRGFFDRVMGSSSPGDAKTEPATPSSDR